MTIKINYNLNDSKELNENMVAGYNKNHKVRAFFNGGYRIKVGKRNFGGIYQNSWDLSTDITALEENGFDVTQAKKFMEEN